MIQGSHRQLLMDYCGLTLGLRVKTLSEMPPSLPACDGALQSQSRPYGASSPLNQQQGLHGYAPQRR